MHKGIKIIMTRPLSSTSNRPSQQYPTFEKACKEFNITLDFAKHNAKVLTSFSDLKTPQAQSDKLEKANAIVDLAARKIQRCYRQYHTAKHAFDPVRAHGSIDQTRHRLLSTINEAIGKHYWANFECMRYDFGLKIQIGEVKNKDCFGRFKYPVSHVVDGKPVEFHQLIAGWPEPEKQVQMDSFEKSVKAELKRKGARTHQQNIDKTKLDVKFDSIDKAMNYDLSQVTPNTMLAYTYSEEKHHRAFEKRLAHDHDLYMNCLQFVHLMLYEAGITDLQTLKDTNSFRSNLCEEGRWHWLQTQHALKPGDVLFNFGQDGEQFQHVSFYISHEWFQAPNVVQLGFNNRTWHVDHGPLKVFEGTQLMVVHLDDIIRKHLSRVGSTADNKPMYGVLPPDASLYDVCKSKLWQVLEY